ncbi:MAG: efflux RND transporter permease subunit [Deltaproteobacteria bacterium]|nr:efflux RND transporter permease subunit [Deltaproteobacteria bacterium]
MTHKSDDEHIHTTRNAARFSVEHPHIAWILLVATLLWGVFGYYSMPQRKDPDIPVRQALVVCPWPGVSTARVEQLITRRLEEKIAENRHINKIESTTRMGVAVITIELDEKIGETGKEFDDIKLKLDSLQSLPEGAGPIIFVKDFGDTATLMLTVAIPKAGPVEIALRARDLEAAIRQARSQAGDGGDPRFSLVFLFPTSISPRLIHGPLDLFFRQLQEAGAAQDLRLLEGPGFVGLDGVSRLQDGQILAIMEKFVNENLRASEISPDVWEPVLIREPQETAAKLGQNPGDKYTYREMDDFTKLIERTLLGAVASPGEPPIVSKVTRSGLLPEEIFLEYSQVRLASYGINVTKLPDLLKARNISMPGGVLEIEGRNLTVEPTGEFQSEKEIGDVMVAATADGTPVYLRDLVDIARGYESPPRYVNFYLWRDAQGRWQRSRAVTLAVQMRGGEKIGQFGKAVDEVLAELKTRLPEDLILARTSDQPLQVMESIDLFMRSLYEAIILVVLVSWLGFWEWRSALLMAASIPLTLAMTFGMMHLLHIDLQQVSIASLIIALGLLVDDPVVAGDAIKRELDHGQPRPLAAWLGPTKLAAAILYATITNIVAYLPFLMVRGDTGRFLYSLPVVMTCSLVASRIVSMTFIPLLGRYLLRPGKTPELPMEERRRRGLTGWYYRFGMWNIEHRWWFLGGSMAFLALGVVAALLLKPAFFPMDYSYLSYVEVWLPEDAPLAATDEAARKTEAVIQKAAAAYGRLHPGQDGRPRQVLHSLTTFVGGGGPRFWFTVSPEVEQLNYAQIIIQVNDKHDTNRLAPSLQQALAGAIPGARIDVKQLETGTPIKYPVAVRLSGEDSHTLRDLAAQVKTIFRAIPQADRIRDNWGTESLMVRLKIDPDRANLAGVTNLEVAAASAAGMNGYQVGALREGDKIIPVKARLRMEERSRLSDLQNLYVYSSQGPQRVPLGLISQIDYQLLTEKICRRQQFRTIEVACFPVAGVLPSEVLGQALPDLIKFRHNLPPGYKMEIGGEQEEQDKGFGDLTIVMVISVTLIYLALVFQFKNAVKPLIVFATIPYGMVGALLGLLVMGQPFGFMAFLGIVSLVGVIVSHEIVLFDFIEEKRAQGEPLYDALLDSGILRLRPVAITVGATVIALVPLALHGGPLWQPLCYAQIGGLLVATVISLVLVKVFYAICVLDLKIIKWEKGEKS